MIVYDTDQELPTLHEIEYALDIFKPTPLSISRDIWRDLQEVKYHCAGRRTLKIVILDTIPKGRYCVWGDTEPGYRVEQGIAYGTQIVTICPLIANCGNSGQSSGNATSRLHHIRKGNCKPTDELLDQLKI